jgi:hypothetical protein
VSANSREARVGDRARADQTVAQFGAVTPGSALMRRSDRLPLSVCVWIWLGAGAALWAVTIYLASYLLQVAVGLLGS